MIKYEKYLGFLFFLAFLAKGFGSKGQFDPVLIVLLTLWAKTSFAHTKNVTDKRRKELIMFANIFMVIGLLWIIYDFAVYVNSYSALEGS